MSRFLFLFTFLFFTVAGHAQNVAVGEAAPDFTLTQLNGGTLSLGDYAGQVRFLNFFGST